ncbi:MAG: RnfABCDGE type electron transport complex subunit D [Gemmiger sp.]|nr:RnfABCDGE type electron transport complex subunit D [Gemmiger sp.]
MPNPSNIKRIRFDKNERSANFGFYTDMLWCCVPLLTISCFYYGMRPALLALTAVVVAYLCDCIITPLHGDGYRSHEPSSECFALLIVMMLPATTRYSIVVTAVIVAVLAKEAFGCEGHYPFHPTAVGVVVVGVCWPQEVFLYPAPGTVLPLWDCSDVPLVESMNVAIKSGGLPTASTLNLITGNVAGPLGAVASLVLCTCGLFLLVRGHLHLSTVLPFLLLCGLLPWLYPQLNELPLFSLPWTYVRQRIYLEKYMLLSGAVLFGGIFLACEPVTQPNRTSSRIVYGAALGLATVIFRYFGEYETGICFALLMVNAIPEWLDRVARRTERVRFMKKEEKRLAKRIKQE